MKEAVKGRAPVSMDALVQQTESSFIAGVLHFPFPAKFRMPHIEMFDGTKRKGKKKKRERRKGERKRGKRKSVF